MSSATRTGLTKREAIERLKVLRGFHQSLVESKGYVIASIGALQSASRHTSDELAEIIAALEAEAEATDSPDTEIGKRVREVFREMIERVSHNLVETRNILGGTDVPKVPVINILIEGEEKLLKTFDSALSPESKEQAPEERQT